MQSPGIIRRVCAKLWNGLFFFAYDRRGRRILCTLLFVFPAITFIRAQCPPNIGFENGDFSSWTCFAGIYETPTLFKVEPTTAPLNNRHTVLKRKEIPDLDPYGDFPVTCPNGSNYSIRLGNNETEGQVDGVSYTVTVPADKDIYSIIYNYAVVFENPDHKDFEQPKFSAKVFDVATNQYIQCSSFDFTSSASLPGFKLSTKAIAGNTSVYYKGWSPVTIKLIGYAGKTVRIEFVVNDCTLGAHFGYAYLDINEDCSTPIAGNIVCNGAESSLLVAPFGFREYRWFNADFSRVLGTANTLRLSPAPVRNTVYAVEVQPFPGAGCVDTLYTSIQYAPVPFRFLLADSAGACAPGTTDITAAHLTAGSTAGLRYNYYLDSSLNHYVEIPSAVAGSGLYYVKAANAEGCIDVRPIIVSLDSAPEFTVIDPPIFYYPDPADITLPALVSTTMPHLSYRYWKDENANVPVADPRAIDIAGTYYIQAITQFGCTAVRPVRVLMQIPPPPNAFSPNNDGIHDTWNIPGLNKYPQARVDIYDRLGRLVFHSIGYNHPWDGTINGKPVPVATYYYVIKTTERLQPFSGSVTVIR